MDRRKNCTYHCSDCGAHFNGLVAFDLHLHRINQSKNRWKVRTYDLEHSIADLELWTTDGYCDLIGSESLSPVVVWKKPSTEAERERFARMQ